MVNGKAAKTYHYLLLLLAAFPLLKLSIISFTVILLACAGIVRLITEKDLRFSFRHFITGALLFLVYALFLLFSEDTETGCDLISRRLLMLAIPALWSFRILAPDKQQRRIMMQVFCYSAFALAIFSNALFFIKGYTVDPALNHDTTFLYRTAIEEYSGLHPTYLCSILYFAVFLLLFDITHKRSQYAWLDITAAIVMLVAALAAASRSPMVAFSFIALFLLWRLSRVHKKQWLLAVFAVLAAAGFFSVPSLRNRVLEVNPKNMSAPRQGEDNGTNVRAGILKCDIALLKEHWLTGVGTGSVQDALNECLSGYETDVYERRDYNTHNEYINAWLNAGIAGIAALLYMLISGIAGSVRNRQVLYFYFFAFISICFVTENFLDRQAGIAFFVFFQNLYLSAGKEQL